MKDENITEEIFLPTSWREILDMQKVLLAGTDIISCSNYCRKTSYGYFAFNGDIFTKDGKRVMINRQMTVEDLK
jgi:uncharacterized protein YdgA (DUF945 family)